MVKLTVLPRIVRDVADALAIEVDDTAEQQLTVWLDELVRWNATHDLTAARSSDELADLMLADAFILAHALPRDARLVDVGSGAGAPGLPLAFLRPDLKVTLVEPLQKRVAFMRGVLAKVDRLDVSLQNARSEALPERGWQIAISRATLPPPAWLPAGAALVEPGGEVVVLLAQDSPPGARNATIVETRSYEWPRTRAARTMVRYRIA